MSVNIFGYNSSQVLGNNRKYADSKFIALTKHLQLGLASKLDKDGDTMKGNLDMNGNRICNITNPRNEKDAVNKSYVDEQIKDVENNIVKALDTKVNKNDAVEGDLNMNHNRITNLSIPLDDSDAVNKQYFDKKFQEEESNITEMLSEKVNKNGDTMFGDLDMLGN